MARIKDSSVEAVRQGADFVAVVEDRTQLRKQGGRLVGRCPFHEERTPSFSVNPTDKLFYCFGCHQKGDMIRFVQEIQGLDFVGAVEWLAERFRIPLEYEETSPQQAAERDKRQRLYALLDQAATYYERTLWDSQAGGMARDYLKGRGLGEDVCRDVSARSGARRQRDRAEGGREGIQRRGAARGGSHAGARRRLLPAASALPAGRRARPGASASRRGGCTRTTR